MKWNTGVLGPVIATEQLAVIYCIVFRASYVWSTTRYSFTIPGDASPPTERTAIYFIRPYISWTELEVLFAHSHIVDRLCY